MNAQEFITGFFDELTKVARASAGKPPRSLKRRVLGSALKGLGLAGLASIPLAIIAERGARGFGRGVAEAADRPLSHER